MFVRSPVISTNTAARPATGRDAEVTTRVFRIGNVRAPRAQMPPYSDKILADADLADIYAFAQARPKAATPALLQP